jgi:hypothetical protein
VLAGDIPDDRSALTPSRAALLQAHARASPVGRGGRRRGNHDHHRHGDPSARTMRSRPSSRSWDSRASGTCPRAVLPDAVERGESRTGPTSPELATRVSRQRTAPSRKPVQNTGTRVGLCSTGTRRDDRPDQQQTRSFPRGTVDWFEGWLTARSWVTSICSRSATTSSTH